MGATQFPGEPIQAGEYLTLADRSLIDDDERVELLDGLVVNMSPQGPLHAATVWQATTVLQGLLGSRLIVRSQMPLILGTRSVPEPDIAVVPWRDDGWQRAHPDQCLLAIEVAEHSLAQDRLTKSRIYARGGVRDYWIVNLRDRRIEWFSDPDAEAGLYRHSGSAEGGEVLRSDSTDLTIPVQRLLPAPPAPEPL